jgi:Fe-S cluster biogenesis protein NfuA/rhodanese-related sulfurtransferase
MKFTNQNVFDAARHEIEPEQCLKERKKKMPPIILDIRSKEEYAKEHLIGSYSFPEEYLKSNLTQIPPYAQVILYADENDQKTADAVKLMVDNKFTDVAYVKGGIQKLLSALKESNDEIILSSFPESEWQEKIENTLDEKIRPVLASDGGGLQVVKIEKDKVYIHYQGACQGCASAATGTLNFIRNTLSTSLNHEIDVVMA